MDTKIDRSMDGYANRNSDNNNTVLRKETCRDVLTQGSHHFKAMRSKIWWLSSLSEAAAVARV